MGKSYGLPCSAAVKQLDHLHHGPHGAPCRQLRNHIKAIRPLAIFQLFAQHQLHHLQAGGRTRNRWVNITPRTSTTLVTRAYGGPYVYILKITQYYLMNLNYNHEKIGRKWHFQTGKIHRKQFLSLQRSLGRAHLLGGSPPGVFQ